MGSQLTTLTSSDIERFERDGCVVVRQAFSPAAAHADTSALVAPGEARSR